MTRTILLISLLMSCGLVCAQGIDNDSTHHYIVIRPYWSLRSSHILHEGHRIKLYDRNGKISTGRLYFINDSTIQTINASSKKKDTCSIDNISKIKIYSPWHTVKGYGILATGAIVGAIGIDLFFYSDNTTQAASETMTKLLGIGVISTSLPIMKHGYILMSGKTFNRTKHKFIYYISRGKTLKRKELKTLFPIQQ